MLADLEVGEVEAVEPERLARKRDDLPPAIARAWDETPPGEARRVMVKVDVEDRVRIRTALLRLLQSRAKSQGLMAFKASATPVDEGLLLYWQKKPGRRMKKPEPPPTERAGKKKGKEVMSSD